MKPYEYKLLNPIDLRYIILLLIILMIIVITVVLFQKDN